MRRPPPPAGPLTGQTEDGGYTLALMRLLVTGGAGFIGSNFVRYWVEQHPEDHVVAYDVLTYAGNRPNLADVEDAIVFVQGDICDGPLAEKTLRDEEIDTIVHFAAESHNSLAVLDPGLFFRTNVLGTQTLLEAARQVGIARFHHISTCEVYGDLALDTDEVFTEDSPYRPRTPYNASKAGADHAVRAYGETYGLPVTITNCSNNYGPYQFPEKVIPVFTTAALDDKNLTLYATTENRREWLHVRDHCTAIEAVLERGTVGETYHVGSGIEASIMEIADLVLKTLGKPASLKEIVPDRPGHDRRYLLDSSKLRTRLGWAPSDRLGGRAGGDGRVVRGQPRLVGAAARPGTGRRGRMGLRRLTPAPPMRVLVTGADGQLGRDLLDALAGRVPVGGRRCRLLGPEGPLAGAGAGYEVLATDIGTMRVDERDAVQYVVRAFRPDLVLHGGALTAVDACESDVDLAYAVNAVGTRNVAEAAAAVGAHLLYVSTDYVFDGTSTRPYREWDAPNPMSVYGASKLAGERECPPGSTIVRTSWVCGAHGNNMVKTVLRLAAGSDPLRFVDDQHGSPTFTADLAAAIVTLGTDRRPGIFHVTNSGATTWCGFVRAIMAAAGADPARVHAISTADLDPSKYPAPRPANSVLDNMALRLSGLPALPDWNDGLRRLVRALDVAGAAA